MADSSSDSGASNNSQESSNNNEGIFEWPSDWELFRDELKVEAGKKVFDADKYESKNKLAESRYRS